MVHLKLSKVLQTNKHFIFLKLIYYVLNTLIATLTPDLGQQNINKLYEAAGIGNLP